MLLGLSQNFLSLIFPKHIAPLGLVPQKETVAFHLIHHLSFPTDTSINDGISISDSNITHQTLDDVIHFIFLCGIGCLMAKSDIASALLLPIHLDDYILMDLNFNNAFYHDKVLPME